MSLLKHSTQGTLFSENAASKPSLFPENDPYRQFALLVYPKLVQVRPILESCYDLKEGRPAWEPVLLLGVTILQYIEDVPDRQAVGLLRYHVGWNFALNRHVGDQVFHPTTLVYFRQRLLRHGKEMVAFKAVLDGLVEAGLIAKRSRQRIDSTQVFGKVAWISRVDLVRETMALALKEIDKKAPADILPVFWDEVWENYTETKVDYRSNEETLGKKLRQAGEDMHRLLQWLQSQDGYHWGEKTLLLKRVFHEQFIVKEDECQPVDRVELKSDRIQSPHEAEATYSCKGRGKMKREHIGYKVQVAETVQEKPVAPGEPTPNFITSIVVQQAHESDLAGAEKVALEQKKLGIEKPTELYADAAYISAEKIAEAQKENRELLGPALPSVNCMGPSLFKSDAFNIEVESGRAVCPAGHLQDKCSQFPDTASGKMIFEFVWYKSCAKCPLAHQCLGAGKKRRVVRAGLFHSYLQQRRREQITDDFKEKMKRRNGIEGTHSELIRGHGLRHARYRGRAKMQLQGYFTAAACNIKRWFRRIQWLNEIETELQPS